MKRNDFVFTIKYTANTNAAEKIVVLFLSVIHKNVVPICSEKYFVYDVGTQNDSVLQLSASLFTKLDS